MVFVPSNYVLSNGSWWVHHATPRHATPRLPPRAHHGARVVDPLRPDCQPTMRDYGNTWRNVTSPVNTVNGGRVLIVAARSIGKYRFATSRKSRRNFRRNFSRLSCGKLCRITRITRNMINNGKSDGISRIYLYFLNSWKEDIVETIEWYRNM